MQPGGIKKTAVALFIISLLTYIGTAAHSFSLDDEYHIKKSDEVKKLSFAVGAFASPTWPGNLYRPTLGSSLALTYAAAGLDPVPYHLTNIILFALVVVAVYLFLLELLPPPTSFIASVLFAVHPIHSEVVANISHRSELLAALFGLLYLRSGLRSARSANRQAIWGPGTLLLLALLSKESAFAYVPLLGLCLIAAQRRAGLSRLAVSSALACVCYLALRVNALGTVIPESDVFFVVNPLAALPAAERAANAALLLAKYALKCAAPLTLSHDYSYAVIRPLESWLEPTALLHAGVLGALIVAALLAFQRRNELWLWPAWFLTALAVQSNILFPIGTVFAERLAFTASLAFCVLGAELLMKIGAPRLRLGALLLLCACFAAKTVLQNRHWESNTALHTYGIHTVPESAKAQQNFAVVLMNQSKFKEALGYLAKAVEIYPAYGDAVFRMGLCYEALGRPQEAQEHFRKAYQVQPEHTASRNTLGWRLVKQLRFPEARPLFEQSLKVDPKNFRALLGTFAVAIAEDKLLEAQELDDVLKRARPADKRYLLWRKVLTAKLQLRRSAQVPPPADQPAPPPQSTFQ